ncbi:MAG: iron ABC transporter permease [Eubacteriales bacterium]|nr:iron ABC transporter permease [Eubacteriales bacterium]
MKTAIKNKRENKRPQKLLAALLPVLIISIFFSILGGILLGTAELTPRTVLDVLRTKMFGIQGIELQRSAISIVWELRFPRVLLALAAGGGLAVAGAAMQAVTQNVMADPYILGASSGASAAVAFAFVLGGAFSRSSILISGMAFTGAMLALFLVYSVGRVGSAGSASSLVLSGMAISVILTATTQFFISVAPDTYTVRNITAWTMGSLSSARWNTIGFPCIAAVSGSVILMLMSRAYNLLSQGDETAVSLGLDVRALKRTTIIVVSFITGAVVSVGGVIGFIGFIVPHVVRFLLGSDHRRVFPFSFLIGGLFLMWMDVLARTAIAPKELPVGIFTAFCGGPFFIWLLYRKNRYGRM